MIATRIFINMFATVEHGFPTFVACFWFIPAPMRLPSTAARCNTPGLHVIDSLYKYFVRTRAGYYLEIAFASLFTYWQEKRRSKCF
jgi:hypothetical protein